MAAFLVRRIAQGLVVVVLVATTVFFLIHAAPGDPFSESVENPAITESVRAAWRHSYGLDLPLGAQFVRYIASLARGDLGFSHSLQRPVADALKSALPNTLLLMAVALAAAFLIGIAVAVAQVRRRGGASDRMMSGISIFLFAIPDFWLATLMVFAFAYWIPLFPIDGSIDAVNHDMLSAPARALDRVWHLILPALTLALLYFPLIARHQRAALLDAMTSDYIVTGRAKGVSENALVSRHALRNSLLPVATILGLAFPALLTGAVFVEKVFSWPGMGLLIVNAIGSRDYALLTAAVFFASVFVVTGSILADVLYRLLDPRARDEL